MVGEIGRFHKDYLGAQKPKNTRKYTRVNTTHDICDIKALAARRTVCFADPLRRKMNR